MFQLVSTAHHCVPQRSLNPSALLWIPFLKLFLLHAEQIQSSASPHTSPAPAPHPLCGLLWSQSWLLVYCTVQKWTECSRYTLLSLSLLLLLRAPTAQHGAGCLCCKGTELPHVPHLVHKDSQILFCQTPVCLLRPHPVLPCGAVPSWVQDCVFDFFWVSWASSQFILQVVQLSPEVQQLWPPAYKLSIFPISVPPANCREHKKEAVSGTMCIQTPDKPCLRSSLHNNTAAAMHRPPVSQQWAVTAPGSAGTARTNFLPLADSLSGCLSCFRQTEV